MPNSNMYRPTYYYCFYSPTTDVLLLFVRIYPSPRANSSKHGFTIVLGGMRSKSVYEAQTFLLNASLYFQLFTWHVPEPSCLAWLPWKAESEMEISTWWFIGAALRNTTCEWALSAGRSKERLKGDAAPTKAPSVPQEPDDPSNLFQTGARRLRLRIPRSTSPWL